MYHYVLETGWFQSKWFVCVSCVCQMIAYFVCVIQEHVCVYSVCSVCVCIVCV